MNEQELSFKFYEFLRKEKNYPNGSLLRQAPAYAIGNKRVQPDLLIIDTRIGEYIGLVEFSERINPNIKKVVQTSIQGYIKALNDESLPFYLVFPIGDTDFQILITNDKNEWIPISKEEFPEFETLSTKKKIEEKTIEEEIEKQIKINLVEKKKNNKNFSLWTLTSLTMGILTALFTFYLSSNFNKIDTNSILSDDSKNELELLRQELNSIISNRNKFKVTDTIYIRDSTNTFKGLNNRVLVLEEGLVNNPEKTLKINAIYNSISELENNISKQNEIMNLKNDNLKTKIEFLNALVIGMIIAVFGSSIGFVIYSDRKKNNS